MTTEETKLYKSLDEILWNDWDPIGINAFGDDARNKYLPEVSQLKINKATKTEITNYLDLVVTDRIKMETNRKSN